MPESSVTHNALKTRAGGPGLRREPPDMPLEFVLVDAFTREAFAGNPCAVFPDAGDLDARTMQRIANEMNLSETAFVVPSERADAGVRYFTPIEEMPLAGHPTIATAHVLYGRGRIGARATFEMPVGIVPVVCARDGDGLRYTMTQPAPRFLGAVEREWIARGLGLAASELLDAPPPQTVSTGSPMLMVPLAAEGALDRCAPDRAALFADPARAFLSVHAFVRLTGADPAFAARHFSPPGDVPEDPVTGSACGAMSALAFAAGLIDEPVFTVSQGRHVGRPGTVFVEVLGRPDAIAGVRIGGHAVTVATGRLDLS
jgi:trans-2,3-dihydro-3-hydroxyanthranilate isomerase